MAIEVGREGGRKERRQEGRWKSEKVLVLWTGSGRAVDGGRERSEGWKDAQ